MARKAKKQSPVLTRTVERVTLTFDLLVGEECDVGQSKNFIENMTECAYSYGLAITNAEGSVKFVNETIKLPEQEAV